MKHWEDLVLDTAERFGGTFPQPTTADTIAAVYAKAPTAVTRQIDQVAESYAAGTINSPWGILKSRVQRIQTDQPKHQAANDQTKAIERAEQWLRNAGLMYDRESEILDELFGDRGSLRHHDTPTVRQRILELWRELAPVGAQLEQDATDRGLRHQAERAANPPARKPVTAPDDRPLEIKDGIRIP